MCPIPFVHHRECYCLVMWSNNLADGVADEANTFFSFWWLSTFMDDIILWTVPWLWKHHHSINTIMTVRLLYNTTPIYFWHHIVHDNPTRFYIFIDIKQYIEWCTFYCVIYGTGFFNFSTYTQQSKPNMSHYSTIIQKYYSYICF